MISCSWWCNRKIAHYHVILLDWLGYGIIPVDGVTQGGPPHPLVMPFEWQEAKYLTCVPNCYDMAAECALILTRTISVQFVMYNISFLCSGSDKCYCQNPTVLPGVGRLPINSDARTVLDASRFAFFHSCEVVRCSKKSVSIVCSGPAHYIQRNTKWVSQSESKLYFTNLRCICVKTKINMKINKWAHIGRLTD